MLCRTLQGHGHWVNILALNTDYVLRTGAFDPRKADLVYTQQTLTGKSPLELKPVCWFGPTEIRFGPIKSGKICNNIMYNVIWTNQKTVSCVLLAMGTCNVWPNRLSRFCQSIRRHFKCFVNKLNADAVLMLHSGGLFVLQLMIQTTVIVHFCIKFSFFFQLPTLLEIRPV